MTRDLTLFPEDDIGNTLWQMQEKGEDLLSEREIEFSILFSEQALALKFGQLLLENNQKISFTPSQARADLPWEITAYPQMPVSYENITSYQALLETSAEPLQGQFDGVYFVG
ncbi:ribonuclease E inhibitor RraB [Colwellia ponticola]|uniref:Ribonuclease E inhibitor RraB n=1 Tax=Colwellia ponticola TaxID=2304625 RepID=A0A8H2JQ16_9GAMM|nr:ribonuclease E inhibitor RraB [Colwellia ponticola]TMM46835.1 ribonuclease E inhibitor RraB [Colwellia ponticola]